MTFRIAAAIVASLFLLGAQTLGLHWHGNVMHAPDASAPHGHPGPLADLAVESAPVHLDEHLVNGDYDLESELAGAKAPLLVLFIAMFVVLITRAAAQPVLPTHRPLRRPPRFRFNPFQLPPSHAPPHRA